MSKFGDEVNKLIKKIKDGAVNCDELYNLTFNHLEVVAYNYLFDTSYIEDVMSAAYIKIYSYLDKADPNKNCYGWLCKIVQHTAYEFNRNHGVIVISCKVEEGDLFSDIENHISEKNDLIAVVKQLPAEDRKLIYYRFWEDLSYGEIALKLKLKKNHVYKRIVKLLKIIKEKL